MFPRQHGFGTGDEHYRLRVVYDHAGPFYHISDLQLVEKVHGCRSYAPCVEVHAVLRVCFGFADGGLFEV
jgi:hypothetical protein